ncbi:hypothetical protein GpartN1_g1349.t1 [Galdieria partita]|uniref:Pyruvate kinase n=1 Tax=Galdieria partita TaxID=83374 RepID=A0A9C7PRU6_9RHOD|nr:hypothetical protein GpartN1_g1349.t1 [Galdieria partita]
MANAGQISSSPKVSRNVSIRVNEEDLISVQASTLFHGLPASVINLEKPRRTGIICTIGPKTLPRIGELLDAGMNVMRLNFSHGTHEYHESCIRKLREELKKRPGMLCAIALDTKGPEIRTGLFVDSKDVRIEKGSQVTITTEEQFREKGTASKFFVDYKSLCNTVKPGMYIFISDGILRLKILECRETEVVCEAVNSAVIGDQKGVNLPGAKVDLPAVSKKDIDDLHFGVQQGVDVVFASFIREASQVLEIRRILSEAGANGKDIKIFSKIENQQGLDNFEDILKATDGVMVARGDLGIEIAPAKVFVAQKKLIRLCNIYAKPVICATQMLESMVNNPRPSRAEVSDVGNAVVDGADCVMLSDETAKGDYPVESVQHMDLICVEAEGFLGYEKIWSDMRASTPRPMENVESVSCAAVMLSFDEEVKLIVLVSENGKLARKVSKYHPNVPVIAITRNPRVARQQLLSRGILSLLVDSSEFSSVNNLLNIACHAAMEVNFCKPGDKGVAIYDTELRKDSEEASVMHVFTVE